MLKSNLLKKTLSMTLALILVMSLCMNVFAATITKTKTQNEVDYVTIYCSYNNMYSDIENYWVSSSKYYSDSEGYTGYLNYQGYYIVSYTGVAANTVECQVAFQYSGTVTQTINYPDSKTMKYTKYLSTNNPDDVPLIINYYKDKPYYYNDEHYSGTLQYIGIVVVFDGLYYTANINYSGTVYFHY